MQKEKEIQLLEVREWNRERTLREREKEREAKRISIEQSKKEHVLLNARRKRKKWVITAHSI